MPDVVTRYQQCSNHLASIIMISLVLCHSQSPVPRRTFGVSVQTYSTRETTSPAADDAHEKPARPQLSTTGRAALPLHSTTHQDVKRQTGTFNGTQFNATQWGLLIQCIIGFWMFVFCIISVLYSLERCRKLSGLCPCFSQAPLYGLVNNEESGWYASMCRAINKLAEMFYVSAAFIVSVTVVIVVAVVVTACCLFVGWRGSPPTWFNQMESAEHSAIQLLAGRQQRLPPSPVPTPAPSVSPAPHASQQQRQQDSAAAEKEYQALRAKIAAMEDKEKKLKKKVQAARATTVESTTTGLNQVTTVLSTTPPSNIAQLKAKLAVLKAKAMAKKAAAQTITTTVPAADPVMVSPPGAAPVMVSPCSTVAPAPIVNVATSSTAAAIAAPAPVMMSPCTTVAPVAPALNANTVPTVTWFSPPSPCECKAAAGNGHSYVPNCKKLPGGIPFCVVTDPACNSTTKDAGVGTGDKIVICVQLVTTGTPYSISLDRSLTKELLGVRLMQSTAMNSLVIMEITGGLVQAYNAAHPGRPAKVGDAITAVNGKQGTSGMLMQECMKKQMLHLSMESHFGYPIETKSSHPSNVPPALATGKCAAFGHNWGVNSVCLNNNKAAGFPDASYLWHCPWESMMLVSTVTYGGCAGVRYDCTGTNVSALLDLYKKHDTLGANHPPEGSLKTVEYVACCIKSQCLNKQSVAQCGDAPWIPGKSVSPFVGVANPCGAAGCERRYSISEVLRRTPLEARPTILVSSVCLLILAGLTLVIRRRGQHG